MNGDKGAFMLSHTWNSLLQRPLDCGGRDPPDGSIRFTRPVMPAGFQISRFKNSICHVLKGCAVKRKSGNASQRSFKQQKNNSQ